MLRQHVLRTRRLHFSKIVPDARKAVVFLNQCGRGLLSDAGDAGDVVGSIAHQRLYIDEFLRRHAVCFLHIVRIIIFGNRLSGFCLRNADAGLFRGELQQISVTGDQRDFKTGFLCLASERSQNIVRFESGQFKDRDAARSHQFLHDRDLLMQFLGHAFSGPLVFREHFMAEGRLFSVKCHRQIIRFFFIDEHQQRIHETEDRIRMHAGGIRERRHAVECAVEDAVSVDCH